MKVRGIIVIIVIIVIVQTAQRVLFERVSKWAEKSEDGYRVSAQKTSWGWQFSAWAPLEMPAVSYERWHEATCKEHYAIGEQVPQRRRMLGMANTAAAARSLCDAHSRETG